MKYLIFLLLLTSCGNAPAVLENYCTTTQNQSSVSIKCPDGTQSIVVNVNVVQFCPGTANYPTTFPESALCINNKLYGVFWMNNSAWLGEIPPGNYLSTSTSLACSFSVQAGCNIIN